MLELNFEKADGLGIGSIALSDVDSFCVIMYQDGWFYGYIVSSVKQI